jgi:hypothetical protein
LLVVLLLLCSQSPSRAVSSIHLVQLVVKFAAPLPGANEAPRLVIISPMWCCKCHNRTCSTELPNSRVTSSTTVSPVQCEERPPEVEDRTDDWSDIRQIFENATAADNLTYTTGFKSNLNRLAVRLRRKLSPERNIFRPAQHSKLLPLEDLGTGAFPSTENPTEAGYDPDARELQTLVNSISRIACHQPPERGRGSTRRSDILSYDWTAPANR